MFCLFVFCRRFASFLAAFTFFLSKSVVGYTFRRANARPTTSQQIAENRSPKISDRWKIDDYSITLVRNTSFLVPSVLQICVDYVTLIRHLTPLN